MSTQSRPYVDFQQVKQRVSFPEVLAAFGVQDQFQQAGETLAGICPLPCHAHGPSPNPQQFKATVRDGVWLWHCFGDCQRGGDVVEFVKLMTGHDSAHVRFWFAERFADRLTLTKPRQEAAHRSAPGSEIEEFPQDPPPAAAAAAPDPPATSAISEIRPLRFQLRLERPVTYLRERGVTDDTAERYGIGLCRKGLLKGYVAIPVYRWPADKNPVAYLGRWPGDDFNESQGWPRYRLPTGFPKQLVVYGMKEALDTPPEMPLIVVEGPFAVYHLVQAGFPATVAALGSSLSDAQAAQLLATRRPIVLLFDGDEAGRNGMRKAAGKLITGTFVRVIALPDGTQPDDHSPTTLAAMLSETK